LSLQENITTRTKAHDLNEMTHDRQSRSDTMRDSNWNQWSTLRWPPHDLL